MAKAADSGSGVPGMGARQQRPRVLRDLPSPGKINLFLHILGRRNDGYHHLQTAFQFLDYCDRLSFKLRADKRIRRLNDIPEITEQADLVVRAARLLQQTTGVATGADIEIRKVLPVGGGLGGGSSNAATTLLALNYLWETGLSRSALADLGLQLGADVPVFIFGRSAWAEGVGERLVELDLARPWYAVIAPGCRVATAAVFSDPRLTRNCPPITISDFIAGRCTNVCEAVVRKHYPQVGAAMDWLAQFGSARMSGTGACVFAGFGEKLAAQKVIASLPDPDWKGFVARGLNHSPLLAGPLAG